MYNSNNRVVITGIGILSPLGTDTASTWQGLISGRSGIDYITLFDASDLKTRFGGEVKGFIAEDYISRKDIRRMDRFTQLAVAAAKQSAEQSKILTSGADTDAIGTIIGSGIGGMTTLFYQMKIFETEGPSKVSPFLVPMMINDMAAGQVSIYLGIKGPNFCITSACSSGSDAIGTAFETIKRGDAQAIFAGGSESISNPLGFAAFNACKALSTRNDDPQKASRPFDTKRDGFVMSEGAAIMVLESLEHAIKRGADIIAEVVSYGDSGDAFHVTQPREDGEGAARAIKMALDKVAVSPSEISYINAKYSASTLTRYLLALRNP